MMPLDEQQRDRLESHALFDQPISNKEYKERLFIVIRSIFKRGKAQQQTKRINLSKESDVVTKSENSEDHKDSLYQAWQGMPRDRLKDILIDLLFKGCFRRCFFYLDRIN